MVNILMCLFFGYVGLVMLYGIWCAHVLKKERKRLEKEYPLLSMYKKYL